MTERRKSRRLTQRAALMALGLVLVALWGCWWANSLGEDRLVNGDDTWVPVLPFLCGDFLVSVDRPCRLWLGGADPYPPPGSCVYPPLVLGLFAWSGWLEPAVAARVWFGALVGLAGLGAWACWRTRAKLGLWAVPLPFVLAAVLYSTPVLFALERANIDLLVLPFLLLACWALQGKSLPRDGLAGLSLALAAWIKLYPGLLLVGLVALRRWRALGVFVVAGALIGLSQAQDVLQFARWQPRTLAGDIPANVHPYVIPTVHTLTGCWKLLWRGTLLESLGAIPSRYAWAGLMLPLLCWVSYRVWRCPSPARVLYPYFLWIVAVATFLPPIANDYNLVFLPLAALAVWDRRDPVLVHMMMGLLLLWWQPLTLPIQGSAVFVFKLLGVLAVGVSLTARAAEQAQAAGVERPAEEPARNGTEAVPYRAA
jgi:hypothetical protein